MLKSYQWGECPQDFCVSPSPLWGLGDEGMTIQTIHIAFIHTVNLNSAKKVIPKSVQLIKLLFMLCWDESLSLWQSVAMGWVRAMASGNAEAASRLMPRYGRAMASGWVGPGRSTLHVMHTLAYPGIPA